MTPRFRTNAAIDARAWKLFGPHLAGEHEPDAVEALRQITAHLGRGEPVPPNLVRDARIALVAADIRASERRLIAHLRVVK